jgi:PAS domain S-box-containing protein
MNSNFQRLLAQYPLETLLQTIPTGLFLVDCDKTILYWNDEAERITGFSAEDAVGRCCSFLDGVPCRDECGLFDPEKRKPIVSVPCSVRHKDGHWLELSKNVDLIRNDAGEVIGGIEAFVDISWQRQQEENLRAEVAERTRELEAERNSLRSVLDGMLDPAYICDTNYHITFANRAMQDIVGEVRQQYCYQAIFGSDCPCEDCPMVEVLQGRINREERYLKHTGRTYEVIHSPYPQGENPTHKLSVCRDITERIENNQRLLQANRELDAFVSTVSHDLRAPLTPLIGFAELLEERSADQLDEIGLECIREIRKTAGKMQNLLEDLLSLSRVGQLCEPDTPVDPTRVVHDVLAELADKVLQHRARVSIAPMPAVFVPEALLTDLFHNLLANALNYAAPQDPRIEVQGQRFIDRVRFSVIDYGPGIAPEEREKVFEPFQRGKSAGQAAGTGVGLATVAKIARFYNGLAHAEETPGGGTTVVVDLVVKTREQKTG